MTRNFIIFVALLVVWYLVTFEWDKTRAILDSLFRLLKGGNKK